MIQNIYADRARTRIHFVTVECSICGAQRGEDYRYFSCHLAEHGPDDVGGATDV